MREESVDESREGEGREFGDDDWKDHVGREKVGLVIESENQLAVHVANIRAGQDTYTAAVGPISECEEE